MPLQDLTPQLRTRLRRVERLVGLFVALATVLLVVGFGYYFWHTAARRGWFVIKCPCHTYAKTAEGMEVGDPVVMMGFNVGKITSIEANQPNTGLPPVFIGFNIRQPYYGYIWTDTKLKIAAATLLGKRQLQIVKGAVGQPVVLEEGGRISKVLVNSNYVAFAEAKSVYLPPFEEPSLNDRAEKLLGAVEKALPNILVLTNQLAAILSNTTVATANATVLTANLNKLVVDAQPLVGEARVVVTNLPAQVAGTFVNVNTNLSTVAANLNRSLSNLAGITSNLNLQVQSNDRILTEISDLVIHADDMLQGLKRHWLLKSAFPAETNRVPEQILSPSITP